MKNAFILGNLFLIPSFLYYIFLPTKQRFPAFYPEVGFSFFFIAFIGFLLSILWYRKNNDHARSLAVTSYVLIIWIIYLAVQLLNDFVLLFRLDIEEELIPIISPSLANIEFFALDLSSYVGILGLTLTFISEYFNWYSFLGIFGILINLNNLSAFPNFIKKELKEISDSIELESKISLILGFLLIIASLFTFFLPVWFLNIEVEFIIVLLSSWLLSSILFIILILIIIRLEYYGIDKNKINIRRNSVAIGLGVSFIISILSNILELIFFSNFSSNEVFFWRFRDLIIDTLFNSLLYLQIALGITIVYKILKFANFAQAEFATFGAYVAFLFGFEMSMREEVFWDNYAFLTPPFSWIAIFVTLCVFAFFATALLGLIFDRLLFKPLRKREASPATMMISSFALGLAFRMVLQQVFSPIPIDINPYFLNLRIENLLDNQLFRIIIIAIVLVFTFFFQLLLYKSKTGKKMRAVADNEDLAKISGIKAERIYLIVWIIAAGFAGVAGLLITSYPAGNRLAKPDIGFILLLPAFAVVVLGGIGSFEGAVIASFIIGFTENIGVHFFGQLANLKIYFEIPIIFLQGWLPRIGFVPIEPSFSTVYKIALSYGLLIVILLIRPYGLFGEKPSGDRE